VSRTDAGGRIIRSEWVVVGDPAAGGSVVDDGAVLVLDGRIAAVGPAAQVLGDHPGVPVERLERHVLIPGLVNAHAHLAMTMFRGTADDRDLADFLSVVMPLEARTLTPGHVEVGTRSAAVELLRCGVTTSLDMYFHAVVGRPAAAEVGLRVLTGPTIIEGGPSTLPWDDLMVHAEAFLAANPSEGAWRPVLGPHGTYTVSPSQLDEVAALAADHDCVVQIHLSETEAENRMVVEQLGRRPLDVLDAAGLLGPDTVLAHGVHLDADEQRRVAAAGAAVAHCPVSNLKLASGVAPVPGLLAAGATVALGTDGAASANDLDLLAVLRLTALLHKGAPADPGGPDATNVAAAVALRMATLGGATALGIDDHTGSIEVGKLADLVAVDLADPSTEPVRDPVAAVVYGASRSQVRSVWVAGQRVVRDGGCVNVDERDVVAELQRLGDELLRG
jgi:5-methylthioadenosine/S-adenosylhomocysteine deaminase